LYCGADSPNDIGNGTGAISGIRLTSNSGVTVENNIVRNLTINGGSNVFALFLENVQGNSQVYGNKIYNLKSTSTSTSAYLQGIRVDVPATHQAAIYNNIVFGFTHAISTPSATMVSRGIAVNVTGTGTVGVTYNTVHLNLGAAATNTAMWIGTGAVTLANNIFANSSTAGATSKRYCIYRNGAAVLLSNYNDFYIAVNTNNFVGYYAADMIDLLAWQGASLQDANSVNIDPLFTGADNLRPTNPALNNLGTPVPITTDIDGVIRDAAFPDMGAYEFTPPSCIMPLAIVVTNITANSADLGWTSSAS
jgi:trimeric autotransporter adhesin